MSAGTTNHLTPHEVRNYEGHLYAVNLTTQTIMYTGAERLVLGPKGSPTGVAYLPREIALSPGFNRTWRRGNVRVIDQDAYDELVDDIDAAAREREARRSAEVLSVMESTPASKDLHPVRNAYGEIGFETGAEREASGRAALRNDESFVSLGQVPTSTGVDESTGTDSVQNVQVTLTETMKEGK